MKSGYRLESQDPLWEQVKNGNAAAIKEELLQASHLNTPG